MPLFVYICTYIYILIQGAQDTSDYIFRKLKLFSQMTDAPCICCNVNSITILNIYIITIVLESVRILSSLIIFNPFIAVFVILFRYLSKTLYLYNILLPVFYHRYFRESAACKLDAEIYCLLLILAFVFSLLHIKVT